MTLVVLDLNWEFRGVQILASAKPHHDIDLEKVNPTTSLPVVASS